MVANEAEETLGATEAPEGVRAVGGAMVAVGMLVAALAAVVQVGV